ncbi:MAG: glutamine amidotransferase [Hadesarchaea archaeon YNP_N21]|jgi:5'-phosphate synthase pdxT subunit|nr:MAG: glutamine amidotransferase [Hadesarchaea archaeon YNP_N21]
MRIGVVGLQGDVSEHLDALTRAMQRMGIHGEAIWVNRAWQTDNLDGVIIPGGESTTIGKLMEATGIFEKVRERAKNGMPIMGTCAGLILLAKKGDEQVERTGQPLLGLMDIKVVRNAFGRQRESFEVYLDIPEFGEEPFECVFIRAPAIEEVWGDVKVLAKFNNEIVAARQRNFLALAFHPELTGDTRAHEYFLKMCLEAKK